MRRWSTVGLGALLLALGLPVVGSAPANAASPLPGDVTTFPTSVGSELGLGEGVAHPDGSFWVVDGGTDRGLVRISDDGVVSRVELDGVVSDSHLAVAVD